MISSIVDRRGMIFGAASLAALSACSKPASPGAGGKLSVIRLTAMGAVGSPFATGYMGILQSQKLLEQEFEKDGIRIAWTVVDGAGPAQNEAIANNLTDFAQYGALPNIVGKARGLPTKILASYGYANNYVGVRKGLGIHTPADLRGKSLAVDVGHIGHLTTAMLLKDNGIPLKEVKLVNLGGPDALAALAAGRVDATLGSSSLFSLQRQGLIDIIFSTRDHKSRASNFGGFIGVTDFTDRHPDVTLRVVKSYIKAVHWVSLPENRDAYLDFLAKTSTTTLADLKRDTEGQDLRERTDPLVDDYYVSRYRDAVQFSQENDLIRKPVDVDGWLDRKTVQQAISELGLNGFWTPRDAAGAPVAA